MPSLVLAVLLALAGLDAVVFITAVRVIQRIALGLVLQMHTCILENFFILSLPELSTYVQSVSFV